MKKTQTCEFEFKAIKPETLTLNLTPKENTDIESRALCRLKKKKEQEQEGVRSGKVVNVSNLMSRRVQYREDFFRKKFKKIKILKNSGLVAEVLQREGWRVGCGLGE